ncbi:MAG: lysophospholipid acyltransferase family protein [Myxococcota bacterium]
MAGEGWVDTLQELAGELVPSGDSDLRSEIDAQLARVPNELNEYGFDRFGMSLETMRSSTFPGALLYKYYFRVETHGIEHMPEGRVLVIANHAGQLPFDATMLSTALLLEANPPRLARGMAEYFVSTVPMVNVIAARGGAMAGTPRNCTLMLENEECVIAFPEGVRGMNKLYRDRYELQRFGLGFMRLALETDTPIVPVGIVGSEEQQPGFANLKGLGRMIGMPALPITLGFPWLGPLGMLPLPVKYRIHFGKPLRFEGEADEDDAQIQTRVDVVKREIKSLLDHGVAERTGIFT